VFSDFIMAYTGWAKK